MSDDLQVPVNAHGLGSNLGYEPFSLLHVVGAEMMKRLATKNKCN